MKQHNIEELNRLYKEAEEADSDLFAEMRSNLLLVSGNHYSKRTSQFFSRVRQSSKLAESTKLRLTKNHVQKITKHYENSINSRVPGVTIAPQNDLEMQDKKCAELNLAVWQDAKVKYNLKERFKDYIKNFVQVGEMCAFLYWDPNQGEVKGYEPQVGEDGLPVVDPMTGQMLPDESKPVFMGGFDFKNIPGFNLLRAPGAQSMKSSPYHILREMVDIEELKEAYANDPDKLKYIGDEADRDAFVVFDTNKNSYGKSGNQVLVRYHFFKPCRQYPLGYFYISTERGILDQKEIPYGIYPIIWEGFDTYATNPRGYSIVKVARPYQAEINRAASQAATHQITVGDDKVIYQGGTKLAPGALLPGVRGITYQGQAPQILPGRDGGQFLPYIAGQITEMYQACMVEEISQDANFGQMDPYTMLFRSASQKAKFSNYIEKVESFMKEFCLTYLDLARKYLPDDYFVQAVGKSEAINIAEFRTTDPLTFKIKIEEQDETAESRFGKQLALNHVLQYAGNQLSSKEIGLVLKEMPFLNNNSLFQKLSLDYQNAENDMLAIERGEQPFISPYADNKIFVDAVTFRMKQSDFKYLHPQIQKMYSAYLSAHEQEIARKAQAEQAAKDGFIPTGGALVTCSMHLPDPKSSGGTRQLRLPYESLMFLVKRLEAQGTGLDQLSNMNSGAVADISGMVTQGQQMPPQLQQGMPV